jgi:hypothetical protein
MDKFADLVFSSQADLRVCSRKGDYRWVDLNAANATIDVGKSRWAVGDDPAEVRITVQIADDARNQPGTTVELILSFDDAHRLGGILTAIATVHELNEQLIPAT